MDKTREDGHRLCSKWGHGWRSHLGREQLTAGRDLTFSCPSLSPLPTLAKIVTLHPGLGSDDCEACPQQSLCKKELSLSLCAPQKGSISIHRPPVSNRASHTCHLTKPTWHLSALSLLQPAQVTQCPTPPLPHPLPISITLWSP